MKRNIVRIIFLLIALGCFGYVGWYYYDLKRTENDVSALSTRIGASNSAPGGNPSTDAEAVTADGEDEEEGQRVLYVLSDFEPLLDKNQNIIGWITIDGTKVNYPVMQSVNGDSNYYLDHNFDQQEDKNGSLFMDDRCDVIKPTVNLIIYGHHMRSGAMFGDLDKYLTEERFNLCLNFAKVTKETNTVLRYEHYDDFIVKALGYALDDDELETLTFDRVKEVAARYLSPSQICKYTN